MIWVEEDHPRDEEGRFKDKNGFYKQNISYGEIVSEEETAEDDLKILLGPEYIGYTGKSAIEKIVSEKKGYIRGAFHREDIGDIDLLWGNSSLVVQHIILQREKQGIDTNEFFNDLTETIENGNFRKKNERGNFEIMHNGKIAVISPEYKNHKITFLLTAFKTHSKK